MLVLTRRSKDKVSFPQVGITIHFIRVQSGHVKIGIDAPRDIAILRGEIDDEQVSASLLRKQLLRLPREVRHGIRNELHEISVGLHLYRELQAAGMTEEAEEVFGQLQKSLVRLDENQILQRPEKTDAVDVPGTIVLVEDVANEREMLASFLRLRGHHVVSFSNGEEALEYLAGHDPPSVVLMDMKMPRCDGPTAIRQIRADRRIGETRVFAISGTSPKQNGLETGRRGVDRWFPKPVNPDFLLDAIDTALVGGDS